MPNMLMQNIRHAKLEKPYRLANDSVACYWPPTPHQANFKPYGVEGHCHLRKPGHRPRGHLPGRFEHQLRFFQIRSQVAEVAQAPEVAQAARNLGDALVSDSHTWLVDSAILPSCPSVSLALASGEYVRPDLAC